MFQINVFFESAFIDASKNIKIKILLGPSFLIFAIIYIKTLYKFLCIFVDKKQFFANFRKEGVILAE